VAILEFCNHQDAKRAASLTITAQAAGFAAGLLVGGALTEYGSLADAPLLLGACRPAAAGAAGRHVASAAP
jgi:hypothetical protein